jgi:predicted AAA+ superfamily ATPase
MHDQRAKMLKYHQDHDVFNENELLKWQHFVLKKLCEQMSRALKENAHMKLSKNVRTQLQNAQIDAEIALISIEICIFFKLIWKYLIVIIEDRLWS